MKKIDINYGTQRTKNIFLFRIYIPFYTIDQNYVRNIPCTDNTEIS